MGLEEVKLFELLKKMKLTISAAESCTGGLFSKKITDIPGASSFFIGSVIAYSNSIKTDILKVSRQTLAEHGAVSEETAAEMATGIRKIIPSDIGISITGIAGPSGGTADKPVGTVCFGFAYKKNIETFTKVFKGDRIRIRNSAAIYSIKHITDILDRLF